MARTYAKLLGPCFKTGRIDDQLLHRETVRELHRSRNPQVRQSVLLPPQENANGSFTRGRTNITSRANSRIPVQGTTKRRPHEPGPTAARQVSAQSSANAPWNLGARSCVHKTETQQNRNQNRWLNTNEFASSIRFHRASFTSSLTLSSKCFATFPHGTCSLSVS